MKKHLSISKKMYYNGKISRRVLRILKNIPEAHQNISFENPTRNTIRNIIKNKKQ